MMNLKTQWYEKVFCLDRNRAPLRMSEIKIMNKQPKQRTRTRCKGQVRNDREMKRKRMATDTRELFMGSREDWSSGCIMRWPNWHQYQLMFVIMIAENLS